MRAMSAAATVSLLKTRQAFSLALFCFLGGRRQTWFSPKHLQKEGGIADVLPLASRDGISFCVRHKSLKDQAWAVLAPSVIASTRVT